MKVTLKGQVTIPRHIREEHGLTPGSEVEFAGEEGKVVIRPVGQEKRRRDVRDVLSRMRGCGSGEFSTDEIMAMTRGED